MKERERCVGPQVYGTTHTASPNPPFKPSAIKVNMFITKEYRGGAMYTAHGAAHDVNGKNVCPD
jgi:hypothetical protein